MPTLVQVQGRVASDPQFRKIKEDTGGGFLSFRVASQRPRGKKNADGSWENQVDFFTVDHWVKEDSKLVQNLKKGDPVFGAGELHNNHYEKKLDGGSTVKMQAEVIRTSILQRLSSGTKGSSDTVDSTPATDSDIPF
jgi:single-stranded DNA-binding protein